MPGNAATFEKLSLNVFFFFFRASGEAIVGTLTYFSEGFLLNHILYSAFCDVLASA